jgi:hypothetical protein
MVWYIRVNTAGSCFDPPQQFSACVEADNETDAREKAIQQVRNKYLPNLAYADTELLEPIPKTNTN